MTDFTHLDRAQVIERIGETDQQFLAAPSPALAKTRAQLRLRLIRFSRQKKEQLYFLTEAVVLLETALMQADHLPEQIELSAALGEIYLELYQLTKEQRYLIISKQVTKPLSHYASPAILLLLARIGAIEAHPSLVRHWITRLFRLVEFDTASLQEIQQTPELETYMEEDWFKQLLKQKLH